ncbi:IclR family transcriptional regulator C-terminal domain-containing protein [Aquamicrobium sp. LC103]|uniref:IclR family transcriptional regulator domain-containing protein n=1 Tax=Aquamicrobium sp. LC103 TaxID=1120658 RepID=UPI00063EA81C|nr:IclR family transcriptional regulator C-terminal domain-containing protein [Aquamicrobium sp. LC103]TKT69253.1 IclR family transcriptional regulator [Aquamicrobium sp. LC103]
MSNNDFRDNRNFVSSFARGLAVIEAFDAEHGRLTLAEVAERTGLDRAVARRLLLTLVQLGLARVNGRNYVLTAEVLKLGYSFQSAYGLGAALKRPLDALSRRLSEPVSVSVLSGSDITVLARSNAAERHLAPTNDVGTKLPILVSASGRLLFSQFDDQEISTRLQNLSFRRYTERTIVDVDAYFDTINRVRADGYAVLDRELDENLISMSVPLVDKSGYIIATLNASTQPSRNTLREVVENIIPILKESAQSMSAAFP